MVSENLATDKVLAHRRSKLVRLHGLHARRIDHLKQIADDDKRVFAEVLVRVARDVAAEKKHEELAVRIALVRFLMCCVVCVCARVAVCVSAFTCEWKMIE